MHLRSKKKLIASGSNDGFTCAPSRGRIFGNAFPGGRSGRLGNHGRAFGRRKCSHRAACKHDRHRRRLVALILAFGPISGAHLNPVVTIADAMEGGIAWREIPRLRSCPSIRRDLRNNRRASHVWAPCGVALAAHAQRSCSIVQRIRRDVRFASGDLGMRAAPFERGGLCGRRLHHRRILVHGFYVLCKPRRNHCARASDTFAGIRPADAPGFIVAQFAGGIAATLVFRWLVPSLRLSAKDVTLPHDPAADSIKTKRRKLLADDGLQKLGPVRECSSDSVWV